MEEHIPVTYCHSGRTFTIDRRSDPDGRWGYRVLLHRETAGQGGEHEQVIPPLPEQWIGAFGRREEAWHDAVRRIQQYMQDKCK